MVNIRDKKEQIHCMILQTLHDQREELELDKSRGDRNAPNHES